MFREPVNALTHLIGAVLSLAGAVLLLSLVAGEPLKLVSFAVYGLTLVMLFSASTLLHAAKAGPRALEWLRILDHSAIFLLIAGSYTPILLVVLRGEYPVLAWSLFWLVWGLALLGIFFKLFWIRAPRWLSTGIYLFMGWLALAGIVPLVRLLPGGALFWLVTGGLFYSVGAVIYALKRPDPFPGRFGYHEIWHLFVLAGAGSHYLMMLRYVSVM